MDQPTYKTIDAFDRMIGSLVNLPDVAHTKPTTVPSFTPITGESAVFIIQTFRQKEVGDTVFVQYGAGDKLIRIAIPPAAADAIARQRDALTTQNRKRVGREQAAARKARGEAPAFQKRKRKK